MNKRKVKELIPVIIVFFVIIILWQIIDYTIEIREIIFPSPIEIIISFIDNYESIFKNGFITATESFFGFLVGSFLAILVAIWFNFSKKSKKIFYPYSIALKASPLYAIAPLLTLWFGNGMLSKIVMSGLVAFFPVLVSAVHGFDDITKDEIDLMKSMSASKSQIFWKLRFPKALPFIFPALKISTTLAVVGATIAEFTGANAGIGYLITTSSYYMETSLMFASIITISIIGLFYFWLISILEKKIIFWK